MGRSSKKKSKKDSAAAKAKKEALRKEIAEINAKTLLVNAANEKEDLLADFQIFASYKLETPIDGVASLSIRYARADDLTDEEHAGIYDLLERNMKAMYIKAGPGWGWNPNDKKRELQDEAARHLLLTDSATGRMLGFAHLRFIMEGTEPVAYLYELQLEPSMRRQGIGRHVLRIAELMAKKNAMRWVMLTVFKCNGPSMAFFEKNKYTIDETSPSYSVFDEECTYEIMSKALCKDAAQQGEAACKQLKEDLTAQNKRATELEDKLMQLGMHLGKMDAAKFTDACENAPPANAQ